MGLETNSFRTRINKVGCRKILIGEIIEEPEKFCYQCRKYYPISNFSANKCRGDGLQAECRLCQCVRKR